jgi:hypothetical protein
VLLISSGHLELRLERFSAHAEVSPGLLIAVEVVRRPTVPAKGNGTEPVEIIDGLDTEYARAALMSPTTSRPKQQTAPKLTKIERTVMPPSGRGSPQTVVTVRTPHPAVTWLWPSPALRRLIL